MDRLIKEETEIRLHPNNINREQGFKFSQAWNPAIKILQTNTRRDRCRDNQEKQRQANIGKGTEDLTPATWRRTHNERTDLIHTQVI
jgi:hypothetical protein